MLSNHAYNLLNQLVEESRSLARVSQYAKDAEECDECLALWEKMKADEEAHVEALTELVKKHI